MKRPVAIVYTSQTGFTARYAGMLARAAMSFALPNISRWPCFGLTVVASLSVRASRQRLISALAGLFLATIGLDP